MYDSKSKTSSLTANFVSTVLKKNCEFDLGVKLPTQVVYYDEIRIGPTRKSVDINMNNPVD